jgi:hypothetical protein
MSQRDDQARHPSTAAEVQQRARAGLVSDDLRKAQSVGDVVLDRPRSKHPELASSL